MENIGIASRYGLENHGLYNLKKVFWNLYPPQLVEEATRRKEGEIAHLGAFVVNTGFHTGRSPNDKYFVKYDNSDDHDIAWGKVNKPISPASFDRLYTKATAYLQGRDVFVQDMQAGAYPEHSIPIRVISELAWASLFSRNMFIRLPKEKLEGHVPQFTILHVPGLMADPKLDGTVSDTFIIANLTRRVILIGGTGYAGEIKKSIFTIMNYAMPRLGILSMHCSANVGESEEVALFFGLSGTGKTTLSSDPDRRLIGDDEHGWSDNGIFNFEGGCYAKTIRLNPKYEPIIFDATRRFGTLLENVVLDPDTRIPDFDNQSLTENTRASYPLEFVQNFVTSGYAGQPNNIFFLTADAFGVMPPIAFLTLEQSLYYFLSGYTSKLAGTEVGLGSEPEATFSTCFGAPFMPLNPMVYADLLKEKITKHKARVWLVNTGWTGGPFGVGKRFELPYTRAMVRAALTHQLDQASMHQDPYFGLWIPDHCQDVPDQVLNPQETWSDKTAYEKQARALIARFEKNFIQFTGPTTEKIALAGPHL